MPAIRQARVVNFIKIKPTTYGKVKHSPNLLKRKQTECTKYTTYTKRFIYSNQWKPSIEPYEVLYRKDITESKHQNSEKYPSLNMQIETKELQNCTPATKIY